MDGRSMQGHAGRIDVAFCRRGFLTKRARARAHRHGVDSRLEADPHGQAQAIEPKTCAPAPSQKRQVAESEKMAQHPRPATVPNRRVDVFPRAPLHRLSPFLCRSNRRPCPPAAILFSSEAVQYIRQRYGGRRLDALLQTYVCIGSAAAARIASAHMQVAMSCRAPVSTDFCVVARRVPGVGWIMPAVEAGGADAVMAR
ncbi:uncharacterized protein BKA78DRAFT_44278 [Phyllosticta capitalensis]|uniref:uncharacterized protein n=1 Tax=Phyllosticta capitalensis TaxID=121624 RepID=UPI00312EF8BC